MKSAILGTAGHVDHGKTTLVEALTGINTDRWVEERERGITIDLGFARFPSESDELDVSVVDVPGHEDFVKNMLAGATGVDLLLLTVAADEGPMPQTREHLWIARLLGVEHGVAAVTKSDAVDEEWIALACEMVREELERVLGPNDWPVIPVSALERKGLDELRSALGAAAHRVRSRRDDDLFRLPVDRVFTVRGVGTVVTGTIWSGAVGSGTEVRILPSERNARVRGVQVHGHDVSRARAGQRAALALVGVDRAELARGAVLTADPVWRPVRALDARLYLLPDSPWSLKNWQRVRFHLGTSETMARVVLLQQERLEPGQSALVQFRLEGPAVARAGDRFVVRFYSPVTTIGGGVILDPWPRRRARLRPEELEFLRGAETTETAERVRQALAGSSEGASEVDLAVCIGVSPIDLKGFLGELARSGLIRKVGGPANQAVRGGPDGAAGRWFAAEAFESARKAVLEALAEGHARDRSSEGVSLESIRSSVPGPAGLVNAALSDLQQQGAIRVEGSVAALAGHEPRLSQRQEELADQALARIRERGLMPPALKDLAPALGVDREELLAVLKFMVERRKLVPVTADLYFDAGAISALRDRVARLLADGRTASPSEFRQALEVSRKYLIPLLEHLDTIGLTQRTGDRRVLKQAAASP